MGQPHAFLALLIGAASTAPAGPREDFIVAAMRLSEHPNYSWVATVADDARTYDITGRTTREGYTWVRMPAINSLRRQLGRGVTDTDVEFLFHGTVDCVVRTEQGWLKPEELPPPEAESRPGRRSPGSPGVAGAESIGEGLSQGAPVKPASPPAPPGGAGPRNYSNLQLGLSLPHEELGIIIGSLAELHLEDGVAAGTLTDTGARLLLVRDGQREITPLRAAGSFRLWMRNGQAARYQVRLEGLLQVESASGRRQVRVTQTTDTELRDVGTTRVEVPAQVRLKLAR